MRAARYTRAAGLSFALLLAPLGSVDSLHSQTADRPTVYRDGYGVPHVFGPTDASVVFGAAWVQAEEDWPAVERNFLRASGRGAELLGEEALADDYIARALEIPRLSREEYERSDPRMGDLLDAYAAGFNAYLDAHPDERGLLERVEPWHTLALIRFKYHQLEFLGYGGFEEHYLRRLLADGWPHGDAADQPGESGAAVRPASATADYSGSIMRFASTLRGPLGDIPLGSNEWALGPSRTADGATMLLVNPHQSFFGVERYVEIHMHSDEGLMFSGLTRFGFLLPYMGNNARLGWTYTDNYADISDLYVERFDDPAAPLAYRYGDSTRVAETWAETVRIADGEDRTLRFWKTHHGPVVGLDEDGRPLAARLARLEDGGWFAQLDAMIRAQSLAEFQEAAGRLAIAYMNLMYADADGNIWYLYGSAVPRRDPSFAWREPVDGSDPRTEWGEYHPLAHLPQVLNPPSGFLLNTNSAPFVATDSVGFAREDFPPYMVGDEENNARAVSSRRVLEGLDGVTFDDFARAVWDTRLSLADSLIPVLVAQWESLAAAEAQDVPEALRPGAPGREAVRAAIERIEAWDRRAAIESVETTWWMLGAERWFLNPGLHSRPFAHLQALAEVLEGLERDWGRREVAWGELNRLQRPPSQDPEDFSADLPSVPVAGAPSAAGSVFVFHTAPGSTSVRYGRHGNSFMKVIEFGSEARGRSLLVFGQSGDSDSRHFFDQAALYSDREFKPAWFTREEVEANAVESYVPGRGSQPQ
ncbi:MAG TPA: penicillin acylase family protein [Gemmatimonadota bacterium]|nr:penicillin acylase family protein [Gemmatimonadota bacterium]